LIEKTTTYFKIRCDDWLLPAKVDGGKLELLAGCYW